MGLSAIDDGRLPLYFGIVGRDGKMFDKWALGK
jgi:hypothetical protein